ncbi:TPA: DUF2179 domain-containing protein [bacterium]|jgi:uncharacterized protein YebE (UPF0316 family)|nr:DUF2179 domain-containing protein [bacterium]
MEWLLILELLIIFVAKVVEVTLATLRIILVNRGYRTQGTILALVEIALWVVIASRVIVGINEQPLKAVVYCLGFALGVYLGSKIENFLAFGQMLIQVITPSDEGDELASYLRSKGIAVTTIDGTGKESPKKILMIYCNRKNKDMIISEINKIDNNLMIVATDVSSLKGGYILQRQKIFK